MSNQPEIFEDLDPVLLDKEYVFCTFASSRYGDYSNLEPLASFSEKEGLTLVLLKETAQLNSLNFEGIFRCISLSLISNLTSVGLTAKISKLLADNDISANIYAGYFHDHIFVPCNKSKEALKLLCDNS